MIVLGLAGPMGAGKDWLFKHLMNEDYQVVRVSFADEVRYEVEHFLNDDVYMRPIWEKPLTAEARALLQWWGTDFRRAQDAEYWLKAVNRRLDQIEDMDLQHGTNVLAIVTDVRFPNEAGVIRKRGGYVGYVWAPTGVRARRLGLQQSELIEVESHISEHALDGYAFDFNVSSESEKVRPFTEADARKYRIMLSTVGRQPWRKPE